MTITCHLRSVNMICVKGLETTSTDKNAVRTKKTFIVNGIVNCSSFYEKQNSGFLNNRITPKLSIFPTNQNHSLVMTYKRSWK